MTEVEKQKLNQYSRAKPKETAEQLVEKMASKGITFNYSSLEQAAEYLKNNNNFLRVYSYRKNYQKYDLGVNKGKYINLDFDYLKELAISDMKIRKAMLLICIDIEHFLKIELLKLVDKSEEDGYVIVQKFFSACSHVPENIFNKRKSIYVSNLVKRRIISSDKTLCNYCDKFHNDYFYMPIPIWELMEIITFGDFVCLYRFVYTEYMPELVPPIPIPVLNSVKSLRNACAHNNCILHNINLGGTSPNPQISKFIKSLNLLSDAARKKLESRPIYEIICAIYAYDKLAGNGIKKYQYDDLRKLFDESLLKRKDYFEKNELIKSSYLFLKKVIDKLK
ncbi:MAG: Abi family protein [Ruminiclostridium sp.]